MSRLGNLPVKIPTGVTLEIKDSLVTVKGPKGELKLNVRPEIAVQVEGDEAKFSIAIDTKASSAFWGMTRSLVSNMVEGVTDGFVKNLELIGVGYRVKQEAPDAISLTLGFSHPVKIKAPEGVKFEVGENQTLAIKGIDKGLVGLTAAKIRKLRKPEPYKGKGIRYTGETVRRKAGKAAKSAK
jgi:large subunit ribosomal protein L6